MSQSEGGKKERKKSKGETGGVKDKKTDAQKAKDKQADKEKQKSKDKEKDKGAKNDNVKDKQKDKDKDKEKHKHENKEKVQNKDTEKEKKDEENKNKDMDADKHGAVPGVRRPTFAFADVSRLVERMDSSEHRRLAAGQVRKKSFLKRKSVAGDETPPGQREITKMLKARPEPTGDEVHARDLIPTAISITLRSKGVSPDDPEKKPLEARDETDHEEKPTEGNVEEKEDAEQAEEIKVTPAQVASRRKHLLLLVASGLVGVCLVSFVVFFIVKAIMKRTNLETLACTTLECQKAVKYVESFTDKAVKPCDDFYRHVCGHWLHNVAKPSTFMADVAHNFSILRAAAIASDQKRSGKRAAVLEAVAKYYRSCTEYFRRKPEASEMVTQFIRNLNITPATWFKWKNEHPVFKELVRLSVVYQLHSLFRVGIETDASQATWTIHRGLAFMHRISDGGHVETGDRASSYFRKVLKAIGGGLATDWTINIIVAIDSKKFTEALRNKSSDVTKTQRFGELSCDQFPPEVWLNTLNAIPGVKPQVDEETKVYAPSFSDTCEDLNTALRNSDSGVRPLYALVLIAAEVVRFDYQLTGEAVLDERRLESLCYEATRLAFENIWVQLLSAFLSMTDDSEASIRTYFQYIINGISKYTTWMDEGDRTTVEKALSSFKLLSFSTKELSDEQLRCSRYDSETDISSEDFVQNRVRVYHRFVGRCFGTKNPLPASVLNELQGTAFKVDAVSKFVVIPHMFGVPPVYYEKLVEQYINFALPGSFMAEKLFRAVYNSTAWRKHTLEKVRDVHKCYSEHSSTLHDGLDEDQFTEVLSTWQAVRAAFSAKVTFDQRSSSYTASQLDATNEMFFKRSCLSLCASVLAPKDPNSLSGRAAHAACLFAVGTMPQFHTAFECTGQQTMYPLIRCTLK